MQHGEKFKENIQKHQKQKRISKGTAKTYIKNRRQSTGFGTEALYFLWRDTRMKKTMFDPAEQKKIGMLTPSSNTALEPICSRMLVTFGTPFISSILFHKPSYRTHS